MNESATECRHADAGVTGVGRRGFLGFTAAAGALAAGGSLGSLLGAAPAEAAERGHGHGGHGDDGEAPLAFAIVSDTHINASVPDLTARMALVYRAVAAHDPAFVLHCGDITDTGLADQFALYAGTVPDALKGKIHYSPGNHEIRWDATDKELYHEHFGPAPYSFTAAGVHFIGFDPTQPLQEPGHYGTSNIDWLAKDLRRVAKGTPTVLFQHFPMGDNFYYVDDQDRFLDLVADHDVRGIFAGHIHQDQVRQLNGMTEVALDAVRNSAVYYWAEKVVDARGASALTVSRVDVAADGSETRRVVATMALSTPGPGGDQRPASVDLGRVRDGKLPVTVRTARGAATSAVQCHAYPQQLFGGAVAGTWTGLTETAENRWTGTLDVSAVAPGVQRLQLRALDADGHGWELTERYEVPLPSRTPAPAGSVRLAGSVQGGIASLGDTVVAVSTGGDVVALRADRHGTLHRDWHTAVGPVFRRPGVSADRRTLYVPSADHTLYALDARDGRRRWTYRADAPVLSSPLVTPVAGRETVVLGAGGTLHAVAADSGKRRWSVSGQGFFAGRAATDGTRLFTGGGDGFLRALDAATGAVLWSVDVTGGDENHRALYGPWDDTLLAGAGVVLASTVSNTTAYDAATGAKRWTVAGSAMYAPKLALSGTPGDTLLITEFGVLTRVDTATGAVRWTAATNVRCMNSGAAVHGGTVWVQSVDGQLIGVDLTAGTVTARLQHSLAYCFSTPAALGDFVVSGDQDGVVRAIRVV